MLANTIQEALAYNASTAWFGCLTLKC